MLFWFALGLVSRVWLLDRQGDAAHAPVTAPEAAPRATARAGAAS
jgi:hypothetical protein